MPVVDSSPVSLRLTAIDFCSGFRSSIRATVCAETTAERSVAADNRKNFLIVLL